MIDTGWSDEETHAAVTCEPVVAILVSPAAVSCEVVALVVLKVGLLEAVVVICQGPHAAGPWPLDDQVPTRPHFGVCSSYAIDSSIKEGPSSAMRILHAAECHGIRQDSTALCCPALWHSTV